MSGSLVLPTAGYTRDRMVGDSGLVVHVVLGNSERLGPFDFGRAPEMGCIREELAEAFVLCAGADGPWQASSSIRTGFDTAIAFVRSLGRLGIEVTSLAQLTPEHWWTWKAERQSRNRWPGQINLMRVLLRNVSCVSELTLRAVNQRVSKPRRRLYSAYTPGEFERLRSAAMADVRAADARIRRNTAILEAHRADRPTGVDGTLRAEGRDWSAGDLLERLFERGRLGFSGYLTPSQHAAELLNTGDVSPDLALFPSRVEVLSLMVLLVCDRGYNLSTLDSLTVPESAGMDETGHEVLVAHLDKPRRQSQRHFTHTFTGASATILRLAVSLTTTARASLAGMGYPTSTLFVAAAPNGATGHPSRVFSTREHTSGGSGAVWSERAGIRGDDGTVLRLNFNRLRLTEQVVNRKSSQNSDAVSEDIYRRPEALTAAMVSDVILDGQADAVAHAQSTVAMRYRADTHELDLPDGLREDLDAGRLDTTTGACLDHLHGPFDDGRPCTASFLLCLACPNAVATPAHLPRLVGLAAALDNLQSADPVKFDATYREHQARLRHLLHSSTNSAQRTVAATKQTDADRAMIERLLRRELDA